MLSSNTFIRILGSIWTNGWKNIAYWEESEQREVLANKFGLSKIQLGILLLVTTPGKFCNCSPLLSLERTFPALKLTENCYLNMNIYFLEKCQFNHKLCPSLLYKHSVPERLSSQSNKMKSLELQKSQFFNSLLNWEKSGSSI